MVLYNKYICRIVCKPNVYWSLVMIESSTFCLLWFYTIDELPRVVECVGGRGQVCLTAVGKSAYLEQQLDLHFSCCWGTYSPQSIIVLTPQKRQQGPWPQDLWRCLRVWWCVCDSWAGGANVTLLHLPVSPNLHARVAAFSFLTFAAMWIVSAGVTRACCFDVRLELKTEEKVFTQKTSAGEL